MANPATVHLNPDDPIQSVRCFNRFYTRQIGIHQSWSRKDLVAETWELKL